MAEVEQKPQQSSTQPAIRGGPTTGARSSDLGEYRPHAPAPGIGTIEFAFQVRRYSNGGHACPWLTCVIDARQAGQPRIGDAFGQALLDHLQHGPERRGHSSSETMVFSRLWIRQLFTGELEWSAVDAAVSERAGPRVLDIGAGAGRHALPLQEKGPEVVALDVSVGRGVSTPWGIGDVYWDGF